MPIGCKNLETKSSVLPSEENIGKAAFDVLRPYYQRALKGETVRLELEVDFQTIGRRWINSVTRTLELMVNLTAGSEL